MAIELAAAYVPIIPETSKIAPGVNKALTGVGAQAEKAGQGMGSRLAGGISKTLKAGAVTAGAAAAGAIGTAMVKGFTRLNALDQANAKLRGLKYSGEEITRVMEGVNASVKGTAYGLDEAASSAAKLGAVSVETGDDLDRSLKLTADIAAQAGTSMDDISSIVAKVAGAGKVSGVTLAQLDDRATGAGAAIADHLGVSIEEMRAQVSAGTVDFATFQEAMESHLGGAAQKTGETFQGSFNNMVAALGRFGATVQGPAFAASPALFTAIGGAVDSVHEAIKPAAAELGAVLTPALERLAGVISDRLAPAAGDAAARFGDLLIKLAQKAADPATWERTGDVFGRIADVAQAAWPAVSSLAGSLARVTASISVATWQALGDVLNALVPVIEHVLVPMLDQVAGLAERHPGLVQAMVGAWLGMKVVGTVAGPVGKTVGVLKNLGGAASTTSTLIRAGGLKAGIMELGKYAGSTNPILAKLGGGVAKAGGAATKAGSLFGKLGTFFAPVGKALAPIVSGFAKLAPIMLRFLPVVGVVTALGTALWAFFTKTETGRQLWDSLVEKLKAGWEWIQGVFAAGWGHLTQAFSAAWQGIQAAAAPVIDWLSAKWAEFTTGFGQFYNTWIRPVLELFSLGWDLAGQAVGVALDWITTKWSEFTTMLGTLWTTYGQPVFSVIQTGAQALGTFLATVWDVAKSGFQLFAGTLAAVWSGVISVVWENIKAGAKIVGTVLSGAWEVVKAGFSALGAIFRSVFDNLIRPVFDLLRNIAGIAADFLTGNFGNIRNRFSEMGEAIQRIVMGPITVAMDAMKAAVRLAGAAWDAFSGTVGKVVGIVRDRVSDMVRVIGEIPGRIRNFFADAGRWLLDAGKNIVGGLIDGIRSMAGSIGSAIADIMPDFGFGGFSFSGGGIAAYARGGIAEAERYANGDVRNGHRPQIARAGSWRVWAEDETGGEGYIPLRNDHRRPRAEAIVADIAQRFGGYFARPDGSPWAPRYSGNLVGGRAFAEGGVTERQALDWVHGKTVAGVRPPMGRSLEGSSYVWGGGSAGNWGDCSGMISLVAGFIRGMWNGGKALRRLFATGSQGPTLRQMGFNLGRKTGPGIFSTGWFNGGPYGGHTAGQIGSTRIEMGGGRGNGQINGRAAGTAHPSFTHHAWIKLKDAAATTFASAVSGSSVDGIPTGGASGPAAAPQTAWGKAQELYTQAAAYMGVSDKAPTISTGGTDTRDPVTPSPDGVPQGDDKPKTSGWGHAHFVSQAVKAVKDRRLPERAAQILAATMFVEAGNPVRKWANRSVPESLAFRHDAVGSDHDSVGDQQQRAPWGPVATRMDSYRSAGLFLDRLVKFNWQAMDPGAAAQKVQVSAHPDRYGQQMAAAAKAVKTTGLYDQGGVLPHGGLALNLSRKPEAILTNAQWGDFELLVRHLGDLVPLLADMAVTGELKANPWIKADSPWAQAAAGVHAWGQQVQDTVHRLGEDAATVGMTLGGAWLGQAEIVRDAERGLAETREQVATELAALSEGETDTEKAREVTDQATRKLAAAERTVAAARVTAVAQLVKTVGDEVGKAAGAVGEFVSSLGKIGAQVDKLRQDVAKLGVEQITTRVGAITAAQGLRVAELDLERTRFAGMVAIARAEDTLTQAQRGHLTMNAASISNLGSLTDRFRVAGVAAMDDLAMSYVVNTGEVAEAEWALRLVRAEAELDQREATWKQTKAAFDLQQATALQVYTAEMQSLVSAQLAAQTEAVMGMSQQAAGGFGAWAQGAQQGAGGLFGLLGNVASGVANFMTGNWAGVAMNVVGGIKNVGDMFAGGNKMKANKDDAEEAMKKMDPSMKFGLVLSLLGGAAATGIGVAGSFAGFGPDAVGWGTQIGSQITQSGLGAITQILTDNTDAVNRRFEAQIEALKRDRDMDQALAGASRAGEEARIAAERASLEAEKAAAQARIEEAKAVRAEESPTVLAALRAQAEAMEARRDRLTAAVDTDRAALDAATAALGPREVVVNISGDAVSTDTLEQTLEEILGQIGGVSVRVNRLETAGRGGLGYMTARR